MLKFLKRFVKTEDWDDLPEGGQADWEQITYSREHYDIHDPKQRREYVQACLDQLADADREMENLEFEYRMVTAYLHDMEEIESLPPHEMKLLKEAAKRVGGLQGERENYAQKGHFMEDEQFYKMEHLAGDIEEGCQKLLETEQYQKLIRQDLVKLDGERQAYRFRMEELQATVEDCRGLAIICSAAIAVFMFVLLILQFGLKMNTQWGYILTAAAAATLYVMVFLRYHEARAEIKQVAHNNNRLILLQNKVKIRYVNNTNLLDYLYLKYQVSSASELTKLWDLYQKEKENRQNIRRAQRDLDENERELLHILRRFQVQDPSIWLHQTDALLDHKEMVEIRHNLIIRRQSLRRRMDYNKEVVAEGAQAELRSLVENYPKYGPEIMAMIEKYEQHI